MKHFWMCACLLFSTLTVWGQTNFQEIGNKGSYEACGRLANC